MLRLHRAKRGENPAGSYDEAADVEQRLIQHVLAIIFMVMAPVSSALSAPYAAVVMDARDGTVYHSRNADTRLHPASLTKMMTLYIAFQAVERGEISLDTNVTISAHAAAEPPSKL
ncbi:MAG: serine hydrolase, partial [Pseudomonadales bacterium]